MKVVAKVFGPTPFLSETSLMLGEIETAGLLHLFAFARLWETKSSISPRGLPDLADIV
jgi:hypothetical protein